MNFTSDIKREIISRKTGGKSTKSAKASASEKMAEKSVLSALVRTSGALGEREGKRTFVIVSETENVAEFFTSLFEHVFGTEPIVAHVSMDKMSGRDKLIIECPLENSEEILYELGLLKRNRIDFHKGVAKRLVSEKENRIGYIKGAFLGSGSCILPSEEAKTGYHLEFVFSESKAAADFCDALAEEELLAKAVKRGGNHVVYIKSKEMISDFLSVIGAKNALKKFSDFVEKRDLANQINRAANCSSGNADKSATATVKQVMAIRAIFAAEGEEAESLSEELRVTARARIENPELSLRELADFLGIGKSCLSHRLRKICELATPYLEKK